MADKGYRVLVWLKGTYTDLYISLYIIESTVGVPTGRHINVLSDYKETVCDKKKFYAVTVVMSLIC